MSIEIFLYIDSSWENSLSVLILDLMLLRKKLDSWRIVLVSLWGMSRWHYFNLFAKGCVKFYVQRVRSIQIIFQNYNGAEIKCYEIVNSFQW